MISRSVGAFSQREMVGCEQRSPPLSGSRPQASLKAGSKRSVDALMLRTLAAAEKVARYRHAQLSAVRLAGDINAKNYDDVTLDELLVTIKSEMVKLGPLIGLDPNQLLLLQGAENRSPVTVNESEPEALSPRRAWVSRRRRIDGPVPGSRRPLARFWRPNAWAARAGPMARLWRGGAAITSRRTLQLPPERGLFATTSTARSNRIQASGCSSPARACQRPRLGRGLHRRRLVKLLESCA
jgi:hypothetical protein